MKLTYKAIARMAGYSVIDLGPHYIWVDKTGSDMDVSRHSSEEDAYKYCCLDNGLVEDED